MGELGRMVASQLLLASTSPFSWVQRKKKKKSAVIRWSRFGYRIMPETDDSVLHTQPKIAESPESSDVEEGRKRERKDRERAFSVLINPSDSVPATLLMVHLSDAVQQPQAAALVQIFLPGTWGWFNNPFSWTVKAADYTAGQSLFPLISLSSSPLPRSAPRCAVREARVCREAGHWVEAT